MKFLTKFFSPSSIKTATWLLTAATFLSYLAGFFRDLVIAYVFGATNSTDAYFASFLIPDLIFAFSAGGFLSGVFMKIYAKELKFSKESSQKLLGFFMFWILIFVSLVCSLCYIFMPNLVEFAFGDVSNKVQIIEYSRLLLFSPLFFTISNFLGSILMQTKHYLSYALSPFFYNFGIIGFTLLFGKQMGIKATVYGVVFGLVLHLSLRFWDLMHTQVKFSFTLYHPSFKRLLSLSIPKIFSLLSYQLTMLFFTKLAIEHGQGVNTAFNLARNIQSFAVSLFGISFATAVYPYLVDLVHDGSKKDIADSIVDSTLRILCYCLAAMFGMLTLLRPLVEGLFKYGSFSDLGVNLTIGILVALLFAIPFEALNHLYSRIYFAYENTWKPVLISQTFLFTAVSGAYFFTPKIGVLAFGLFFTLGIIIQNSLLLIFLKDYITLPFKDLISKFFILLFACFIMVLTVYPVSLLEFHPLVNLLLGSLIGVVVYFYSLHKLSMFKYTGINKKFLCWIS